MPALVRQRGEADEDLVDPPPGGAGIDVAAHLEILADGQRRKHVVLLRHERDAQRTHLARGLALEGKPAREVSALGVAFVPQEHNVFPSLTVRENLEMGGYVDPRAARRRIDEIFVRFPALADKRRHAARTLSGGQRQMLAMAMALMVAPALLLLDEPSAGLAPRAAEQLFDTVAAVNRDGVAIVMVEQNALEALAIARRGYILVDGRNSASGEAAALAADPDVRRIFLGG